MGIFLYIYINEQSQREKMIKEISLIIVNKMIEYCDEILDMNTMNYFKELISNIR